MSKAQYWAGVTQGFAGMPDSIARQDEARLQQKQAEMQMQEYVANAPLRKSETELQLQRTQNELKQAQSQGVKSASYSAFDSYEGDRDTRHLNNFLTDVKQNPMGQKMFGNTVRFDSVTRTPFVESQLSKSGVEDIDGFFADPKNIANYTMATRPDGSQELIDMDRVYAATGYTKYMQDIQLAQLERRAKIQKMLREGSSVNGATQQERLMKALREEDPDLSTADALEMVKGGSKQRTSRAERIADTLQEENPDISRMDALEQALKLGKTGTEDEREAELLAKEEDIPYSQALEQVNQRKERTTAQKSFEEVEAVKTELDEMFDGNFLDADLSDPKVRSQVGRKVARIEKDFPMSAADRKSAIEIRQLSNLASTVGEEITDAETGPLDSLFRSVKKYVSNDIKGVKGVAAYEAYRNTMRHALFGAAQSVGETKNFNKAIGTLAEQTGPVLARFREQTEELKNKLSAIYDLNDEYVAKYRLNMDMDQIASAISALDERLEMFNNYKPTSKTISATDEDKDIATLIDDATPPPKKEIGDYFAR